MADQNLIRSAFHLDGNSEGGFALCFEASGWVELMPIFEEENSYGNGPAWEGIAGYLCARDEQLEEIELDSEGDALLARCARRTPLEKLQTVLIDAATDDQTLRRLINDARQAGFGEGDL